jgi:hypothetical protein
MLLRGALVGGVRSAEGDHIGSRESEGLAIEPGPATQVPMSESLPAGRTGLFVRRRIQRLRNPDIAGGLGTGTAGPDHGLAPVTTYLSQWRAKIRAGERGVMGAPRSRHTTQG